VHQKYLKNELLEPSNDCFRVVAVVVVVVVAIV
jgi:hypothetical protein